MTESSEDTPKPNAAESQDTSASTSAAPTTPATPQAAAGKSRPWSFTIAATVVLATAAIAVMLLAGRPGASQDSAATTAVPASHPVAPPPSSTVSARPGSAPAAKWTGSKKPGWATDGSRTITFELAAESYVPVWMKRVRPVLAVRCLGGSTEVFVVTDSAASFEGNTGRHTVRVGFDGGADVEQQWTDSSDYQSLFAPDGEALARRIARSKRMRFEFTPYSAAPVAADFDVRGFDQFIDSVAKVCRWRK